MKNAVFAGLSAAMLWSVQILPYTESRYCSILNVNGGNGVTGHGFGIDASGRVPRTGTSGDAGADATAFTPGDNPNPVCGSVAKLHGAVNIADQTAKSIAAGVPTVLSNGSIPLDFFQVDRNGGGPAACEYSADGTGNSFEPMDVTLNLPGNFGAFPADRKTWRVVATFKEGSRCSGGPDKNICLVRCRAGQTSETAQKICGGCFIVKLDGTVAKKGSSGSSSGSDSSGYTLTSQQMDSLISVSVKLAKKNNLVAPKHTKRAHHQ